MTRSSAQSVSARHPPAFGARTCERASSRYCGHLQPCWLRLFKASTKGLVETDAVIGVGKAFWPPLPPNRTCGSPAYGSPVAGFLIGGVLVVRGLCRR